MQATVPRPGCEQAASQTEIDDGDNAAERPANRRAAGKEQGGGEGEQGAELQGEGGVGARADFHQHGHGKMHPEGGDNGGDEHQGAAESGHFAARRAADEQENAEKRHRAKQPDAGAGRFVKTIVPDEDDHQRSQPNHGGGAGGGGVLQADELEQEGDGVGEQRQQDERFALGAAETAMAQKADAGGESAAGGDE